MWLALHLHPEITFLPLTLAGYVLISNLTLRKAANESAFPKTLPKKLLKLLTPADADEHPLAQLVGGVGEDDGGVEVAALAEHPEEVCGVKIVEGGRDEAAPNLEKKKKNHNFYNFKV